MTENTIISVHGMSCQKCVAKVTGLLEQFPQVEKASVSLADAQAELTTAPGVKLPFEEIQGRLKEAGFSSERQEEAAVASVASEQRSNLIQSRFRVGGMSCSSCAASLEKGLQELAGVERAQVNFAAEILTLEHADDPELVARIVARVEQLGFAATADSAPGELRFGIEGMSCASCAASIEKRLGELPGLISVTVNLAGNFAQVRYDDHRLHEEEIYNAVAAAGFTAIPQQDQEATGEREARKQLFWVLLAAAGALPIMLLMWFPLFGSATPMVNALLATLIQFSAGLTFYRGAWKSLKNRSANMDVLVALGITAAYGYSLLAVIGLLGPQATVFFETSAMLILFIRFGKWLESRVKGKAGSALKKLLQLQADRAVMLIDGQEQIVPASRVKPGDLVVVRPGEKIPVDGLVVEGSAAVDEAMISGEAVPVSKEPGNPVTGATINLSGRLLIRATQVGEQTVLAQIVRLVETAQGDKAPIQRLADRVSNYFVPVVVLLALLTFFIWYFAAQSPFLFAFQMAIAVVVIACPCALGLATPTAIMVGSSVGLERGILFKKATVLEQISQLQTILLDKTGTLTSGEFHLADTYCQGSVSDAQLLTLAARVEDGSQHPLARSIVSAARQRNLIWEAAEGLEELGGHGVKAVVDGRQLYCGSRKLVADQGIDLSAAQPAIDAFEASGYSLVYLAEEQNLLGLLALQDSLKPNAARAIAGLQQLGLATVLLSGDRQVAAEAVARQVGIDLVEAEVLPEEKLQVVKKYQQRKGLVAMVGDGINDAPALAQADIGIAIGSGTDVAKETGDLILVKEDLFDIERGILLGRKTLQKVKQNLFWAFFYNVLGIPLAAGVFYPWFGLSLKPEFAGLAMAFSSVSVVTNSLLLRRVKQQLAAIE